MWAAGMPCPSHIYQIPTGPKQAPKKPGYVKAQVSNHRLIGPTVRQRVNDYPRRGRLRPHKVRTLSVSESCSR